ncbi:hypothetical protein HNY73_002210 [Argiope bruennichi]|uniref:Uncharacterized protein n=1 Tax=Argiope bruennichi TaxID=94029 RepID=A0A8T0FVH5_ARGBR|nr:hypothetical protein HNY73_002210 [Argiope bruennichi]
MLGQIFKLFFPGCLHLLETGSPLLPIGLQRSCTSSLKIDGGMCRQKKNPADIGSRGLSPKDLPDCRLWWEGPTFLSSSEADWPKQPVFKNNDSVLKERGKMHVYLLQF